MSDARVLPFLKRKGNRSPARAELSIAWGSSSAPVEIVSPDEYCTSLLLEYAAPLFSAELIPGPGWVVRIDPPETGGSWMLELLSLIERWLESVPLPCTNVHHDGQSYLIRASSYVPQFEPAAAMSAPAA
jgi:hypothetical protein